LGTGYLWVDGYGLTALGDDAEAVVGKRSESVGSALYEPEDDLGD